MTAQQGVFVKAYYEGGVLVRGRIFDREGGALIAEQVYERAPSPKSSPATGRASATNRGAAATPSRGGGRMAPKQKQAPAQRAASTTTAPPMPRQERERRVDAAIAASSIPAYTRTAWLAAFERDPVAAARDLNARPRGEFSATNTAASARTSLGRALSMVPGHAQRQGASR